MTISLFLKYTLSTEYTIKQQLEWGCSKAEFLFVSCKMTKTYSCFFISIALTYYFMFHSEGQFYSTLSLNDPDMIPVESKKFREL